jgi:hypothetical protein
MKFAILCVKNLMRTVLCRRDLEKGSLTAEEIIRCGQFTMNQTLGHYENSSDIIPDYWEIYREQCFIQVGKPCKVNGCMKQYF